MASTRFVMSHVDFIFIPRMKGGTSRQMLLGSMTCTAIFGNGARTTGWTITLSLPEIAVLIKTKTVIIVWYAAGRGMSHLNFAAARCACECWAQMQMSLWDFGWFVRITEAH